MLVEKRCAPQRTRRRSSGSRHDATRCDSWRGRVQACVFIGICASGCGSSSVEGAPSAGGEVRARSAGGGPSADASMTAVELREARAQAGFKTSEQRSREEAARVELLARRVVLDELGVYRRFVRQFERILGRLQTAVPRWKSRGDYDRFMRGYDRRVRGLESQFQKLEAHPGLKGSTFDRAARVFRSWEDLNTGLGSMEAPTERFELILTTLRADLAALAAELDEIEKDERLLLLPGP